MPTVEVLQQACEFLATRCDGAIKQDKTGFNRMDADFGHSLAQQDHWTEKQAKAALKMLLKYRNQLASGGFDVETMFTGEIEMPKNEPTGNGSTGKPKSKSKSARLVNGETIEIWFDFDPTILDVVKSIPGRRFQNNSKGKYWTVPLSIEAVQKLKENGFTLDEKLHNFISGINTKTVDEVKEIELPKLKRELFPFQKQGVAFIEEKGGRALVADSMGLGKTIQALAWLALHPEKKPVIVLCPASLKLNWKQEIEKTLPDNPKVQVLQGKTPCKISAEIIIINYDILNPWVETLRSINPQVLIFDEAHLIRNNSAIRTKATKKLAKKIPHVIALTGTPIVNRPIEGFNIVQIINKTIFPSFWEYAHKYCGAKHNGFGWDFTGATNKEELHKKLTESIMIRRKKEDVLKDLPNKVYSYVPMELDNEKEYQKAEREFIRYLLEHKGLEAARKAKQAEHLVKIEALKQLAVKGKMKQAVEWIQNFIEGGNGDGKLVVFATHKETINQLMEEFKEVAVKVDGSVNTENRNRAVEKFQNDPTVKLFVGNIQAAGVGLTLTAASSVAFLELPWMPGELVQAEDRCHRIGQKNTVNIYYLLADNTIEYKIAEMLDNKRGVLDAVLDGKETKEARLLTELIKSYQKKGEK